VSTGSAPGLTKISLDAVLKELVAAEWRTEDNFQIPVILITLLRYDATGDLLSSCSTVKLRKAIETLLDSRPRRSLGRAQPTSAYTQFWLARAMLELIAPPERANDGNNFFFEVAGGSALTSKVPPEAYPPDASRRLSLALTRSAEMSYDEMCRQLAFRSAGDAMSFDVIRLAYSAMTYYSVSSQLAGTAGLENGLGEVGTEDGGFAQQSTAIRPPNKRLVVAALAAVFAEESESGLWSAGQPIYIADRKSRSATTFNADPGDAFVFAPDLLGSLLKIFPAEYFRPHLPNIQNTLSWIESHRIFDVVAEYCDEESGQCFGQPLVGWRSNHLSPDGPPLGWCTAQVFRCVAAMHRSMSEMMNADVLREFKGVKAKPADLAAWDRLLDTDVSSNGDTLKNIVLTRMIQPFDDDAVMAASDPLLRFAPSRVDGAATASYSAILFGPPGTAKTTICEAVARRLGWNFLVVDTSAFLADGLTNVAARLTYVFDRLCRLERTVILFDEIEEFCLDRETPGLGMESRMLTTSMLTKINDLRRGHKSIFFVATNRLRAFDSAVTRPGRFDLQLFVGTPNLSARVLRFEQRLRSSALMASAQHPESAVASALNVFTAFLQSRWDEDAMFFNYLESEKFAASVVSLIVALHARQQESADARAGDTPLLTEDSLLQLFKAQAAVMVVRGAVREEYTLSMELSRY